MKNGIDRKTLFGILLLSLLTACGADSGADNSNNENDSPQDNNQTGIGYRSKACSIAQSQEKDIGVILDAFIINEDFVDSMTSQGEAGDLGAPAIATEVLALTFTTAFSSASSLIYCNEAILELNACNYTLGNDDEWMKVSSIATGDGFFSTIEASSSESGPFSKIGEVDVQLPHAYRATITSFEDGAVGTNIEWSRANDGTEVFSSSSSDGSSVDFTENPDCSGQLNSVQINDGERSELDVEFDADAATGSYNKCSSTDCFSGTW